MKQDVRHELHKANKAAQAFKAGLLELTDDEDVIRDMLEGETDLHEIIAKALESIEDDQVMVDGCAARIDALSERKGRMARRIVEKRTLIEQAMEIAELKSVLTPIATVSIRNVLPAMVIQDEAQVPARFWKAQDPKLDRKALKEALDALEADETIPGVTFGNGGVSLTIRRK